MRSWRFCIIAAYLFFTACGQDSEQTRPKLSNESSPKSAGQDTFEQRCAYCHGASSKGDGPAVKQGLPQKPTDLTSPEIQKQSDTALAKTISDGKPPYMPPWKGQISTEEIQNVVKYIRHLGENR